MLLPAALLKRQRSMIARRQRSARADARAITLCRRKYFCRCNFSAAPRTMPLRLCAARHADRAAHITPAMSRQRRYAKPPDAAKDARGC